MKTLSRRDYQNRIRTMNYICTCFAMVLVVLQFIPFWGCYQCNTCGEGRIISINEYVWFSEEHKSGLTSVLKEYYIPDFCVSDVVGTAVLTQFASLVALAMCLSRPTKLLTPMFALIAGTACTIGYLTQPVYQMGQLWQLHLVAGILTAMSAVVVFLYVFGYAYQKAKTEIAEEARNYSSSCTS